MWFRESSVSGQIKTSPVNEGFQGTAIQIKNDNSLGLTLIRMVTIKKKEVLVQMRKLEPLCTLGRNIKWCSCYGKKYMAVPQKLKKKTITIWSNNSTSGKISRIIESIVWNRLCMPMFIAALVTKAKRWKQSKCPSINEWISKKWDNHTIEYYSACKRKKILTHAATRMNLENIMFCEISQS